MTKNPKVALPVTKRNPSNVRLPTRPLHAQLVIAPKATAHLVRLVIALKATAHPVRLVIVPIHPVLKVTALLAIALTPHVPKVTAPLVTALLATAPIPRGPKATAPLATAPIPRDPKATALPVTGPIPRDPKVTAPLVIGLTPHVPLATALQAIDHTPHVPLATAHLAIGLQVVRPVVVHPVATAVAVGLVVVGFRQVPSAVASVVPSPAAVVACQGVGATP